MAPTIPRSTSSRSVQHALRNTLANEPSHPCCAYHASTASSIALQLELQSPVFASVVIGSLLPFEPSSPEASLEPPPIGLPPWSWHHSEQLSSSCSRPVHG